MRLEYGILWTQLFDYCLFLNIDIMKGIIYKIVVVYDFVYRNYLLYYNRFIQ